MKNIPVGLLPKVKPTDPLYGLVETIRSMAEQLETLGGLRPDAAGEQAVTKKQLIDLGVLKTDRSGAVYNPTAPSPALNEKIEYASGRRGQQIFWEAAIPLNIGTKIMTGDALPEGAVIVWAMYRVITPLTSLTNAAVVSIGIETDDPQGLVAPVAISDAASPWEEGKHACIPNRIAPENDTEPATATGRKAVLTVSGEALTAGSVVVIAEYVMV